MVTITVSKEGHPPRISSFDKREITVGRTKGNDLVIAEPGVSSTHARILSTGTELTLIDLESTNGTYVNGQRIQGPQMVTPRDEVFICAWRLSFEVDGMGAQSPYPPGVGPSAPGIAPGAPPPLGAPPGMGGPPPLGGPPGRGGPPPLGGPPGMGAPPPLGGPPNMGGPPPLGGPPGTGAPSAQRGPPGGPPPLGSLYGGGPPPLGGPQGPGGLPPLGGPPGPGGLPPLGGPAQPSGLPPLGGGPPGPSGLPPLGPPQSGGLPPLGPPQSGGLPPLGPPQSGGLPPLGGGTAPGGPPPMHPPPRMPEASQHADWGAPPPMMERPPTPPPQSGHAGPADPSMPPPLSPMPIGSSGSSPPHQPPTLPPMLGGPGPRSSASQPAAEPPPVRSGNTLGSGEPGQPPAIARAPGSQASGEVWTPSPPPLTPPPPVELEAEPGRQPEPEPEPEPASEAEPEVVAEPPPQIAIASPPPVIAPEPVVLPTPSSQSEPATNVSESSAQQPPPIAVAPESDPAMSQRTDDPDRIASTPVQTGRTEMASPEMVEQLRAEIAAAKAGQQVQLPPVEAEEPPPPEPPSEPAPVSSRVATLGEAKLGRSRNSELAATRVPGGVRAKSMPELAPAAGDDLADLEGPGAILEARARVFARVAETLAPDGGLPPRDADARARARTEAQRLLAELAPRVPGIEPRPWANRIAGELCGLGALSAPLAEPDISEVFVHGPDRVLVRRHGSDPEQIDAGFSCPQAIEFVVRRLTGAWFSQEQPVVDARTFDGADVHAVHDTIAAGGPVVSITLPGPDAPPSSLEALVAASVLEATLADLLRAAAEGGLNVLICGGPGANTYPLLAALATAAERAGPQRQVIIRPSHQAGSMPRGVVVLQGDGLDGTEEATVMQSLVRAGLGLSPDRLLLHDVSGPEAADALAALGRGLRGGVLTTRAPTVEDGINRLATLAGLAGGIGAGLVGHPSTHGARAQHVARTFDLAIGVARFADGISRVVQLSEPEVGDGGLPRAIDLALWDAEAYACRPTGDIPSFVRDLVRRGVAVDSAWSG